MSNTVTLTTAAAGEYREITKLINQEQTSVFIDQLSELSFGIGIVFRGYSSALQEYRFVLDYFTNLNNLYLEIFINGCCQDAGRFELI